MQFDLITDTTALCRMCMTTKEGSRTNLYDSASFVADGKPSLHGMLKIICAQVFSNAEADDPPGMPKDVCASCRSATVAAFELHQMCVKTDRLLGELLALRWELQGPDLGDPLEGSDKDETVEVKPPLSSEQLIHSLSEDRAKDPLSNNDHLDIIKDEPLDLMDENEEDHHDSNSQQDNHDNCPVIHVCKICNKFFKKASALKTHMSMSHKDLRNSNDVFKCKLCGERFESHGKYRYHINKHGGNYICPCGTPFVTISRFNRHIRSGACTGDQSTKCEECDQDFPSAYAIANHRRLKHSGLANSAEIETCSTDNHKCDVCEETFPSADAIANHRISVHSGRIDTMLETEKQDLIVKNEEDLNTQPKMDTEAAENEEDCHDSSSPREADVEPTETTSAELYECEICNKYFKKPSALKAHISLTHKNLQNSMGLYECKLCGQTFKSHGKYRYHTNKHGGNYICPCGKPFGTISTFNRHVRSGACTGDQNTNCEECNTNFPSVYALANHRRLNHSGPENGDTNKCEECDKPFPSAYALAVHRRLIHSDTSISKVEVRERQLHSCDICGNSFTSKQRFARHKRTMHDTKKLYKCLICNKTFETPTAKGNHHKTHKGPFKCSTCGKLLRTPASFKSHMLRHKGIKPFACKICPMRFYTSAEINEHTLTHTKSQNHTCEICGSRFTKAASLRKHVKFVHEGERPCECHVCGYKCSITSQLKRHLLTHTKEKPFKCGSCDQAYAQSNDLVKHVARVHGLDKPYQCDRCDESFRLMTDLRQHYQEHAQPGDDPEQMQEVRFTSIAILQRAFAKDKQQQQEEIEKKSL